MATDMPNLELSTIDQICTQLLDKLSVDMSLERTREIIRKTINRSELSPSKTLQYVLEKLGRNDRLDPVLYFLIENYYVTFHPKRGLRKPMRNTIPQSVPKALRKMTIGILNAGRGKIYEQTFGAPFICSLLEKRFPTHKIDYAFDTKPVKIPTADGPTLIRRYDIDASVDNLSIGIEIKSGRISNSKFIRSQIRKDRIAVEAGIVDEVYWFLFRGASAKAIQNLEQSGIFFFDCALDIDDEVTITSATNTGIEIVEA